MAAFIVDAALKKVPELDRTTVDDLMLGCGLPGGEQGFNMGRVVAVLAGMRQVPGCTITRYCSSSLQTMRMASHAIKAGEGDVFIAAGVEAVSRFMVGGSSDHTPNTQNPKFADSRASGRSPGPRATRATWTPAEGLPDVYIDDGRDRGERRRDRGRLAARRWTSSRSSRSSAPAPRSPAGSSSGRSRRTPTRRAARVVTGRRRPAPRHRRSRSSRRSSPRSGRTVASPRATRAR